MLRRVENPPNPFLTQHHEWLGPPPAVEVEVFEEQAASILSRNDSPDISFRWSLNPYRGCQHACSYCYARPTHEYLGFGAGTDFDARIVAKINAPELLEGELSRRSWRGEPVVFSGVTDCYQPLESVYGLTRRCLEVCLRRRNPVGIVTKSYLIVRDADLLADLARAAGAEVWVSIPFADARVARVVERSAPPPQRRLEALKRLHEAGVPVGVMVAPVIPGLNDRDVPRVLEQAAECGARRATYTALRLPGSTREVFLSRLRHELPERARRIEQRIRDMRGGELNDPRFGCRLKGDGPYWESVKALFEHTAKRLGMSRGFGTGIDPASWSRSGPAAVAEARSAPGSRQLPLFGQ
ncbi:MAG TPA: PA0069 family radical SAM protein [Phycisphaerae bacterium]|nr:PA0069 family radical SAM protein [Phycisphaerae bacterium]